MNLFGKSAGKVSWCTVPPKLVRIPRVNPSELHGPHQAAYHVPLDMATCVIECPAPLSPRICQSHDFAPHVVSQPFATPPGSLIQANLPPAIQRFGLARSAS